MKTFDQFLFEADARHLQVGKAAEAGGKLAGGVSGLAGAAGSLASGNFFGGVWGVLKSTLAAFEAITDTANAVSKLSEIQKLHSRLYAHISGRHGTSVAEQYVKVVFEVDESIIPYIPPNSWDSILGTFVNALNGKIEDYQNLTFSHAIATVLEQHLATVKSIVASQQSKWDRDLQKLDHRYHALEDYFEKTAPNSSVVSKSKVSTSGSHPSDYSGFSSDIDIFGEPAKTAGKKKKSWWSGESSYTDMIELKKAVLAKLTKTHLPPGFDDEADEHLEIAAIINDEKQFQRVIDSVKGNLIYNRLTPANIIAAAKKLAATNRRYEQDRKNREDQDRWQSLFGDDGPPA